MSSKVETTAKSLSAKVTRVDGADRYETSQKIALNFFTKKPSSVYIATGVSFPDALVAGAAAGSTGSPVILIRGTDVGLDIETIELLGSFSPQTITIVGGTGTVSAGVEQDSRKIAAEVLRYGGADRYATAAGLAETWGTSREAFLATGSSFPDALTGGVLAGARNVPLIITDPLCLRSDTASTMKKMGIESIFMLGGDDTLSGGLALGRSCV